jgi:penicillin-binding protein 1C
MVETGSIDESIRQRVEAEPVVIATSMSKPASAPHAAWMALARSPGRAVTTIDEALQRRVETLVRDHAAALPAGSDVAVVVMEIESGDIVTLVGSADPGDPVDGQVNGAVARRSPGSALKPFIYAAAFEARRLAPDSIVHDVPIQRAGWAPANFDQRFNGEVTVERALRESLNVPAILVAEGLGVGRCLGVLEAAGIAAPAGSQTRAGLTLAVGGLEVSLVELVTAYATLGRGGVHRPARLILHEPTASRRALAEDVCSAIDVILSSHARPPRGLESRWPGSVPWFMWKTGTSSGRRDAWAVGHNRAFAIGVWAGRFDGGARHAFVGAEAAEPLLARLFALPSLRRTTAPPLPTPWVVCRPLPPPPERDGELCILQPRDGASFVAVDGRAPIHVRASEADELRWFLNGLALEGERVARLELSPGRHELRCVSPAGVWDASSFTIR